MARKGRLEEIIRKALYADDAGKYFVTYRDFENLVEVPLQEFIAISNNFSIIPESRIYAVRRGDDVLYTKTVR